MPSHDTDVRAQLTHFSLNYTFWLNLVFGALALYLFWMNSKNPMDHGHHEGHGHDHAERRHPSAVPSRA